MTDTTSKQLAPLDLFKQDLKRLESDIKDVLPPQIPVEKFIRTTLTAVSMNRQLLEADKSSLLSATMKAAQDGLLCDGREAALVIFNTKDDGKYVKKIQYLPMAAGLLKKIRNSNQVSNVSVSVVYEKDKFTYIKGDDERIEHEPYLDGDPGAVRFAYAIAKLKDGTFQREVMPKYQIDRVRAVSKSKDSGPWVSWYDEMARKTVLRRLSKYLPSSTDIERVFEHDNEDYDLRDITPVPQEDNIISNINEQIKAEKKTRKIKPLVGPAHTVIDGETGEILNAVAASPEVAVAKPDAAPDKPEPAAKTEAVVIPDMFKPGGKAYVPPPDHGAWVSKFLTSIAEAGDIAKLESLRKSNDATLAKIQKIDQALYDGCIEAYTARLGELSV